MDLSDAPDEAQFRHDLRAWLEKSLPELPWPEPADLVEKAPFWRRWQAMLFEAGYAGLTWPREYGGQGLDERMRAIFGEECDLAGAPERLNTIGEDFAGPTIAHFGSQAQKRRFLRPILTGEEIWCQLFSEPDSGSDLGSLRTKATKVEGGWRIQGQKIWTSRAQLAAHAILLARTGGGPRHKGITYFLLPMDSEGVTVRPLLHMLGEAAFNEVFLDDVFRPGHLDRQAVLLPAGRGPGRLPPLARTARRPVRARRHLAGGRSRAPVAPPRQPGTRYGDRRRLDVHPAQHRRRTHSRHAEGLT